jgi:hypothetical protein
MTGRQEYDRTKDRQRILDEYMIDMVASTMPKPYGDSTEYLNNTSLRYTKLLTPESVKFSGKIKWGGVIMPHDNIT